MGIKLGGMTFGSLFKKPETIKYPFEEKPAPAGLKGTVVNDESECILCGICVRTCPCSAIEVDKTARTWSINHFQCVQCQSCVYACPKKCLSMDPKRPAIATEMKNQVLTVPEKPKKTAAAAEA